MSQPSELEPTLVVTVALDGDDDPAGSTENVKRLLDEALAGMQDAGGIRSYKLEVAS